MLKITKKNELVEIIFDKSGALSVVFKTVLKILELKKRSKEL